MPHIERCMIMYTTSVDMNIKDNFGKDFVLQIAEYHPVALQPQEEFHDKAFPSSFLGVESNGYRRNIIH
jgi:hypothetical protein